MNRELTSLSFALTAYRSDHGRYPEELSQLRPKYAAEIPKDLFNDQELRYAPNDDGFLLYSVGPNEKDDGGKGRTGSRNDEPWDDIVVRMKPPK